MTERNIRPFVQTCNSKSRLNKPDYSSDNHKKKMKQRFLDKDWWKNTTGATAGTIIGIILTFGTTFYIENRNKAEMARKTVMITLHNLDSAIDTMEMLLQELQRRDSLFTRVCSLMPDKYE